MAETKIPGEEEGPYNLRSDGEPGVNGHLGGFRRGHVVFTLYEIPPDLGRYPNEPTTYLLDCDDGVGPHEVCRFEADEIDHPMWRGAWNNDDWCPWLIEHCRALIAAPGCT